MRPPLPLCWPFKDDNDFVSLVSILILDVSAGVY